VVDEEGLKEVGLEDGASALEIRIYGDDEEIIAEGDQSDHFYVLLSGNVKIFRKGRQLSILGERDVFGLESCILKHPSSLSARSVESARIALYDRDAIDFILYERPQMSRGILMSLLGQLTQTIQSAARDEARTPVDNIDIRFYGDGEVIIKEGIKETDIFKLVSTEQGLVVLKGGREVGRIMTPGEFFGEMASVLNQKRSATITSEGNSVVQVYSAEHIQDMIEEHPELAKRMISTMAQRLSQATKKITELQKELEECTRSES
jgi:CRP-like cAMP-binding protein